MPITALTSLSIKFYYSVNDNLVEQVALQVKERLTAEELEQFEHFFRILIEEFDLGERKRAITAYKLMRKADNDGEAFAEEFDSEVNLFILSPSLRGMGYGQQMMNRYMKFCRKKGLDSIFLWTTTDCTWQFYERYGFQGRQRFSLPESLSEKEEALYFIKRLDNQRKQNIVWKFSHR